MTKKQLNDLEVIKYFIPPQLKHIKITKEDEVKFLEYSQKGKNKELIKNSVFTTDYDGFNTLCEGKRWRGIHIHELYEKGVLEGSMPYYVILGGVDDSPIPVYVKDFLKKEMFQGVDSEVIDNCYNKIVA